MASETYETTGIRCPHCGRLDTDAWEWNIDESDTKDDWECACGKTSTVTRHTTVSYMAEAKGEDNEA